MNRSLYTLTGTKIADGAALDGEDLASTLLGIDQQSREQPICWRRPPDRPGNEQQDNPDLAIRDGRWKYCVNYDGTQRQLFDLQTDASETSNIAAEHQAQADRLHKRLMDWNASLPMDAGDPSWVAP